MKSHPKLRQELWNQDPHCYWCGCLTKLTRGQKKKDQRDLSKATVDHLCSRYHPFYKNHRDIVVLACARCNNMRGGLESKYCNDYVVTAKGFCQSHKKKDPIDRLQGIFLAMNDFFLKVSISHSSRA